MVDRLRLARADFERMLGHAREGLPNEACGLVAGTEEQASGGDIAVEPGPVVGIEREAGEVYPLERGLRIGVVRHVYLLRNVDESHEHFSMDPREQLAAVRDAHANGWALLGNWHSHPETPARPSEEDKRLAYDPQAAYLILSLAIEDAPALNAYHVASDGAVTRLPIEVVDDLG